MNWNQIESKWAAMTRRVRADCVTDRADTLSINKGRTSKDGLKPDIPAGPGTGGVIHATGATTQE